MMDSLPRKFEVNGNRLRVQGELGPDDERAYSEALFELLKTGFDEIEVDLRGLSYMSSAYVGSTCLLTLVANQRKRDVTLIAKRDIGRILTASGLDKLTTVKIVD
jgi:anti-anti-sigma factor